MRSSMQCFGLGRSRPSPTASSLPPPSPPATPPSATVDAADDPNWWRTRSRRGVPCQSPTSTANTTASSTASTINLTNEYALVVHTNSCNEIRSKIFHPASSSVIIAAVLHPDRATVTAALTAAPASPLHRLASLYFDSSELTSHLCLSLHRAVDAARALYAPISLLLDLLPHQLHLSADQLTLTFDRLHDFLRPDNPFPTPAAFAAFHDMRDCFSDLRPQLDSGLRTARRSQRLLRRATRASAACLIASTLAIAAAALALATHALAALVAAPSLFGLPPDLLTSQRRRLRERIARLDGAARGAYVLNNDLDTIEQLVAGLHSTVESDRALVRLGIERGKGNSHLIEEVLRQLRSSHPRFLQQLRDLDEHVCLCFVAVNRARSLLLHHVHYSATQDSRRMNKQAPTPTQDSCRMNKQSTDTR